MFELTEKNKKREIKYNDISKMAEYREYLRKNPMLRYLFVELTDKCNLSCLHCLFTEK